MRALGAMEAYGSELQVQAAFQSMGLWAAALEHGVMDHVGDHLSKRQEWEDASASRRDEDASASRLAPGLDPLPSPTSSTTEATH